jgi:phosphoglycolate phosphatase
VRGFKLVVFDLDGTLVDASRDIASALNDALGRLAPGHTPLSEERVRSFIGEGAQLLVERGLSAAGLSAPPAEVLPLFLECYRSRLLETTRLYPGVAEALDAFHGTRLAVLTNKPGDLSRALLEGLGVAFRFGRICGGGDVKARKPDPLGLVRLMEQEEVSPRETLMVGDSPIDIQTGRGAGTLTAGVLYGLDPQGIRAAAPDFLVKDPREIPLLSPPAAG